MLGLLTVLLVVASLCHLWTFLLLWTCASAQLSISAAARHFYDGLMSERVLAELRSITATAVSTGDGPLRLHGIDGGGCGVHENTSTALPY